MEDFYLKEDVLEIETQPVFDNWYAWRVKKQNTDVLPYGSYINRENEIIVNEAISRMSSKDFSIINSYVLFLKTGKKDDYFGIVHIDSLDILLRKIEEINELYGVKRRRKPRYGEEFYYISLDSKGFDYFSDFWHDERNDNELFDNGNCFLDKKECIEKLEKIKNILKE